MSCLYAATTSAGKLRDFRTAAQTCAVDIVPLPGIEAIPAPAEDGDTFLANAAVKAVYYSRFAPGELVIADDSGLEVDALGGAPGVRSARYAADAGLKDSPDANDNTDVWNNMLVLEKLAGIPPSLRTARYHCTLVAARDGHVVQVADGAVEGTRWVGQHAKRHRISGTNVTDIGFTDVDIDFHFLQILGDRKKRRRAKGRGDGLADRDGACDNRPVHR